MTRTSSHSPVHGLCAVGLAAAMTAALALMPDLDDSRTVVLDGLDGLYAETVSGDGYFLLDPDTLAPADLDALDRFGVAPDAETGLVVLATNSETAGTALARVAELALEDPDGPDARTLADLRRLARTLDEASQDAARLTQRGVLSA